MKGKDLKWLVSLIPDDAIVTIDNNPNVEITALENESAREYGWANYNLHITAGYSITKDEYLNGLIGQLRRLCDAGGVK